MLARPRPNQLTLLRCEKLHRPVAAPVVLYALSGPMLGALEPDESLTDWLWWSFVTMTHMGCGDVPLPSSWDILRS